MESIDKRKVYLSGKHIGREVVLASDKYGSWGDIWNLVEVYLTRKCRLWLKPVNYTLPGKFWVVVIGELGWRFYMWKMMNWKRLAIVTFINWLSGETTARILKINQLSHFQLRQLPLTMSVNDTSFSHKCLLLLFQTSFKNTSLRYHKMKYSIHYEIRNEISFTVSDFSEKAIKVAHNTTSTWCGRATKKSKVLTIIAEIDMMETHFPLCLFACNTLCTHRHKHTHIHRIT